ncbi:MAG TPA: DUF5906 domain-containing protein [Allosphingosinicella sp.]|nr:DUF5906 domain-containing protein [Allosphingosinicella sp.]
MSNQSKNKDAGDRPQTVGERVQRGRETGSHANGAIVPFEGRNVGPEILDQLRGKELGRVQRLLAAGYRATVFPYRDEDGAILQLVLRFDHPTAPKEIRPLRYLGRDKYGVPLFWMTAIEAPRPLYGLHELAQRPEAQVLAVEGEATAEAARLLFPEMVPVTWMSGAGGVAHTEMEPLAGRNIIIWPDNDIAGRRAGRTFASLALKAGAASVGMVDVPREFGENWDVADEVPEELREAYPLRHLLETARQLTAADLEKTGSHGRSAAERGRLLGHKPGHSEVDKQAVADALHELDPSMSRLEWIKIARCLYLAFGSEGLPMFDAWSKGSEEKYKEGEPAALWSGFEAEKSAFRAKSLAWLMRQARDSPREEGQNFEVDKEAFVRASIEEVNEDHAVVTRGAKTVVIWERYDPRFERYTLTFLKKSDFTEKLIWKIPLPPQEGDTPRKRSMPLGKLWFESGLRRQYEAIYFAPGQSVGSRALNTWRGFAVEPIDNPDGWSRLKAHLLNNVAQGDGGGYEYILNWLAFGVQRLGKRTGTALVLQGAKGAGKSILIVLYGHLFGSHTWVTAISEDIVGRFNAHLETTLLLGVEEAFAPQNRAADGTLKDLITTDTLRVEDKFFSAWTAPNHLRIIMTSNNDQVVRADGFDRRYAVFEVLSPHQNDPDARRRYFGEMVEQMETGGYEAMLGELLSRDISDWNPEAIPETEALKRQKLLNLSNDPVAAWYHSRLEDGVNVLSGEAQTNLYPWSETGVIWVPVRDVRADYSAYAKRHGHRGDDQRLQNKLARYMAPGFAGKPKQQGEVNGGEQVRCYPFPPIGEARKLFAEKTGFTFD